MERYVPSKKKLTEEDFQWCQKALAEAEPYTDEEYNSIPLDVPGEEINIERMIATRARKMLERGWKYY